MNPRWLSAIVPVCILAMVVTAVYKAGPGRVAPQLANLGAPPTTPTPPPPTLAERIDKQITAAWWFLHERQSKDGAWRSDVYATFKDGTALTPLVVVALQDSGFMGAGKTHTSGAAWLAKKVRSDGTIDEGSDGLPYPVYTAALSVIALSRIDDPEAAKARDAWLKHLLARQLTEPNGWQTGDKQYGGWGYYPKVPKKPTPGEVVPAQQLLESNLSATTFALDALAEAGARDEQVLGPALRFVRSCRNADGGFHFIYDDPVRNKAGAVAAPMAQPTFPSYGSATADGLRALLLTGVKPDAPEVAAARAWLTTPLSVERHPGDYIPTHEPNRNAVYFYYAASLAKAFRMAGVKEIDGRHWAESLAEALLARQKPDGSWENPIELVRENDRLLATAYAVQALGECQAALTRK